ncbi:MAG: hypothetical protein IPL19_20875 [Sandaracinaceae bacterium]|jgi:hypothetical protein|nr:hypothetical protein [Sandaracinaceae bacterium]MBK8590480.1 hypothetical protein [Sandaracinaceae bacterium]MBP7682309.1 hypothetical protein [Deltaproteobacteria bacterium]
MNPDKLATLAQVPRALPPELNTAIKPEGKLYEGGCLAIMAGGFVTMVCGGLALFGVTPWSFIAIGLGLMVLGKLAQLVAKPSALARARKRYSEMPLTLGAIVQANRRLYEPGPGDVLPTIVVYIDPTDPQVANAALVLEASARLKQLRAQGTTDPTLLPLVQKMHDERSHFINEPLPDSLYTGTRLRWSVTMVDSRRLPKGHLEEGQVLPFLLADNGPWLVPAVVYM